MATVAELLVKLKGDSRGLTTAVGKAELSLKGFASVANKVAAVGMVGLATATVGVGVAAISAAASFDKGMREVNTLIRGSESQFEALQDQTLEFQKTMGITAGETVPALYQAISAGVPSQNVFEFMEVAGKAAIGGVTDLETAVDGLTSVTNAYGRENLSASRAADIMFTAVRLGKTTFGELSSNLFNVIPIAAATGIEFEQVAAALAALTAQGVPTSVATTQLRSAIQALSAPTIRQRKLINELGLDFSATRLSQIGLSAAFKEAIVATDGNMEKLRRLIGSVEGLQAVLALGGSQSEVFTGFLEQMGEAGGATNKAFEEMEKSTSRLWDRLKVQGEAILIQIGQELLPKVNEALTNISGWVDANEGAVLQFFLDAESAAGDFKDSVEEVWQGFKDLGDVLPIDFVVNLAGNIPKEVYLAGAAAAAMSGNFALAGALLAGSGFADTMFKKSETGGTFGNDQFFGMPLETLGLDRTQVMKFALEDMESDFGKSLEAMSAMLGNTTDEIAQMYVDGNEIIVGSYDAVLQSIREGTVTYAAIIEEYGSIEPPTGEIANLFDEVLQDLISRYGKGSSIVAPDIIQGDIIATADRLTAALGGGGGGGGVAGALSDVQKAAQSFAQSLQDDLVEAFLQTAILGEENAAISMVALLEEQAERQKRWEETVLMARDFGLQLTDINREAFEEILDLEKQLADDRIDEIKRIRDEQMNQALRNRMMLINAAIAAAAGGGPALTAEDIARLNAINSGNTSGTPLDLSGTNAGTAAKVNVNVTLQGESLDNANVSSNTTQGAMGRDR